MRTRGTEVEAGGRIGARLSAQVTLGERRALGTRGAGGGGLGGRIGAGLSAQEDPAPSGLPPTARPALRVPQACEDDPEDRFRACYGWFCFR